jgi:CRP-like cAMP-binding protein
MDFIRRPEDASPLHGPEEAEQAGVVAAARSDDPRISHLARVPLFSGLKDKDLHRVAGISKILDARAGTVLTQMGQAGDSFFVIIDGKAAVQTQMGVADELHPGDFFGEMSLLDGGPRSATITATTDMRLLVVERSHFWRLLDETPDLIRQILMVMSRRVRRLEQAASAFVRGMSWG